MADPADPTSSDGAHYDSAEQHALRSALAGGESPRCPRCDVVMTSRAIGGGSFGLGYARRRTWLICPSCRRSSIFDLRRGTRN